MKLINNDLVTEMMQRAAASDRKRTNHNFHEASDDVVQRYCIAAEKTSYFRPHRHPHNWELALVFHGRFEVIVFDDEGKVEEHHLVGPHTGTAGFEIEANRWHSWLPLEDQGVFFEVKQGPYDPATAAEFAPWSPEDGTPEAIAFVQQLRQITGHE